MTYQQTLDYLYSFIPEGKQRVFPGETGLLRTHYLLNQLGNPQNKLKVIHIAGTSGKGSTAFMISQLLKSQGFTVGLQLSPHLVDIRERFQINNNLISHDEFCRYMNTLSPFIEKMRELPYGAPTFFEIIVVLAFYLFHDKQVDYAVMETGLGGLLDATNCVDNSNKIAIITRIGHDHIHILGNTLPQIAMQKAGIIHMGNTAFILKQHASVMHVIHQHAAVQHAHIVEVVPRKDMQLSMRGNFQKENASLALAAIAYLSNRDMFTLDEKKVFETLNKLSFPGRMDTQVIDGKKVIIDGAHNPQKMKALTTSLRSLFPDQKFTFIVAFKKHKNYLPMLRYIAPLAKHIFITRFPETAGQINTEDPMVIAELLRQMRFTSYRSVPVFSDVLKILAKESGPYVVTGSLYLAGEMYRISE